MAAQVQQRGMSVSALLAEYVDSLDRDAMFSAERAAGRPVRRSVTAIHPGRDCVVESTQRQNGVSDVYGVCMSRTNIDLDDALVAEVMRRFGVSTKKEAIDLALRRLVGVPLSRDFLLSLEGIGWEGSLEEIRREQPTEPS